MKLSKKTSLLLMAGMAMICVVAVSATAMVRMSAGAAAAPEQAAAVAAAAQGAASAPAPGAQAGAQPAQDQAPAAQAYHFEIAGVGFEIPEQWAELANTPITGNSIEFKVPGTEETLLNVCVKNYSEDCTGGDVGILNLYQVDNGKGQRVEFWMRNWGCDAWQQLVLRNGLNKYSKKFLEKALFYQTGGTISYSECDRFSSGYGKPLSEFVEKNICATARVM